MIKMSKNRNKFCRLFNFDIEHEKSLEDSEVRFFHLMLRIVDWDQCHVNSFGSVSITVREFSKEYLPWSPPKVSGIINSLIKKGWLERRGRSKILIRDYRIYRIRSVQEAGRLVQQIRQGVQIPELSVQPTEKGSPEGRDLLKKKREELIRKVGF